MAEAVVGFALRKLADVIAKEAEFLGGVGKKIERVQWELKRIQCCLEDADSKRKDARVQNWLNELRDVAYNIEDATDTFFLDVVDHRQEGTSLLHIVRKNLWNKPLKLYILYRLGTELDNIHNKLEGIFQSRVNYGIKDLPDKGKGVAVQMTFRRTTYQEVDENDDEIVGLQDDKNNILNLLHSKDIVRRAVITIVGPGGLGKTTLAHMVYKSAKSEFNYHIMLSISQQFSLTDLLRKMLLSVSKHISLTDPLRNKISQLRDSKPENQDIGEIINVLRSFLSSRRYLIILDDVWRVDVWNQLKITLPDVKNESRVLMTSRFLDVAESVDSKMATYELDFLDPEKSRDLLLRKALPYQNAGEECPCDLLELADKLSEKCKGLPLALIVVGGILLSKGPSYLVWDRVLRTMDWHSDGKGCIDILAMSYEDMPHYLKPCFLYLSCFPEDYEISAKRLIRMWVAEGFIPCEGKITMEEIAENYIEQLFRRSMVQVSSRYSDGSVKCCQVHDLLRDFAIHEARRENILTVFSEASYFNQPNIRIRRASFESCSPRLMEYVGPNTRSILWFSEQLPKCSNFRLLQVLELVGVRYPKLMKEFEELINLKYLGFRNCDFHISACSFHHMKSLETLDTRGTSIEVSNTLWAISKLRHVLCNINGGLDGPLSGADLRNLQTMRWVWSKSELCRKLTLGNNLRNLGIGYNNNSVEITNLLESMSFLIFLGIKGDNLPMEIVYPKALPNYQNLQTLNLQGFWSENATLAARLFPTHLVKLKLSNSQFKQNPMPELGKLNSLKKLVLKKHVFDYSGPTICPSGFPVLQNLQVITNFAMVDLMVTHGVMPKLTHLAVHEKVQLHLPPELQHVTVNIKQH